MCPVREIAAPEVESGALLRVHEPSIVVRFDGAHYVVTERFAQLVAALVRRPR